MTIVSNRLDNENPWYRTASGRKRQIERWVRMRSALFRQSETTDLMAHLLMRYISRYRSTVATVELQLDRYRRLRSSREPIDQGLLSKT